MTSIVDLTPAGPALIFTGNAAAKVNELIAEEGNPALKLRVYVSGGGCSGFQYGFSFEEAVNEDDTAVEKDGVTLLVDPTSLQYLQGAEIDYQEGLEGSRFVIKNPNATSSCSCGSSFSVEGGGGSSCSSH
ncbi:MAG: iron-sulfur cluster insertion protein ErpA [Methylococcus sp.]|uniref:iron-sulfur cluster insertion protein ErpA n=1 Tax=Methylococcus mesophilus TaxID=2993564 RepID=UPI00224A6ACC|nr:iron-sulfur cluster insertion protein ErpA [Methylococcus mesophilus]MDD2768343.1 iron-sulfur cluster insertion protein ErpA [Methylococcus sp.]UZR31012.1 iron-sulfur cluster insertion protein ErpA [Methylococcus mesophilus]